MNNSGYFFSKYVNTNLLVYSKSSKFPIKNKHSNVSYIFQYNVLNASFMSSFRSKFFKYDVNIFSAKKSLLKFYFPNFPSTYFSNSSFLVSFPVSTYAEIFSTFNLVNGHIVDGAWPFRFSIFPIAIFFNDKSIPMEHAHFFFFNPQKLAIFSDNAKFSSLLIANFYFRQIFTFNIFFSKNGNN